MTNIEDDENDGAFESDEEGRETYEDDGFLSSSSELETEGAQRKGVKNAAEVSSGDQIRSQALKEDSYATKDALEKIVRSPLDTRFRAVLAQAASLSESIVTKRLRGDELTPAFGKDALQLTKLRARILAIQRLLYGPDNIYRALTLADLCESYVEAGMWKSAGVTLQNSMRLLQEDARGGRVAATPPAHMSTLFSVFSHDVDISKITLRAHLNLPALTKCDYSDVNDSEAISFRTFVRSLRKQSKSFAYHAERIDTTLTPFRVAITRHAFDVAGGDEDGFVRTHDLIGSCRRSVGLQNIVHFDKFAKALPSGCNTRGLCCWEEVLEAVALSQVGSSWSTLRLRLATLSSRIFLREGSFDKARNSLRVATTELGKTSCGVHFAAIAVYALMSQLAILTSQKVTPPVHAEAHIADRMLAQKHIANVGFDWLEKAIRIAVSSFSGTNHLLVANLYLLAGRAKQRNGNVLEALSFVEKSIAVYNAAETTAVPTHSTGDTSVEDTRECRACAVANEVAANILIKTGKFVEGAAKVSRAADIFRDLGDGEKSMELRLTQSSILARRLEGQARGAARALEARAALAIDIFGRHSLKYARCEKLTGVMWIEANDPIRATRCLRRASDLLEAHFGKRDVRCRKVRSLIAKAQRPVGSDNL